jgi:uncharacterized C2H2 Zn-finger protein
MVPKLSVKFRRRNGIPYSIERMSGMQFRCRRCNTIFRSLKELDRHLVGESKGDPRNVNRTSPECPNLGDNTTVTVLYALDISDKIKKKYLRLKEGDVYDGL